MTTTLFLLTMALALATLGPLLVRGRGWVIAAPAIGLALWAALLMAMLLSLTGAGVVAVTTLIHHLGGVRELTHRCPVFLAALRAHADYVAVAATGGAGATVVTGTVIVAVRRQLRRLARDADRHRLVAVAGGQGSRRLVVIDTERCAAWSVPADAGGRIFLTRAAVRRLSDDELRAVVHHEAAHLRRHHHRMVAVVGALRAALPCPLTIAAEAEVAVLVEMHADDAAIAATEPAVVRAALLRMVLGPDSPAVLAAAGGSLTQRLARLSNPVRRRWPAHAALMLSLTVAAATMATVLFSVTAAVVLHECPKLS